MRLKTSIEPELLAILQDIKENGKITAQSLEKILEIRNLSHIIQEGQT